MGKRDIHELLDMVLAIGSSSKHFVSFELDTREYAENELCITVYIFEHDNFTSQGVCDRFDITAFNVQTKVWLEAWAAIVRKERDYETN